MPTAWTADFEFRRDHLRVRKTGAIVPYSLATLKDISGWGGFYLAFQPLRFWRALPLRRRPRIAFAPDLARPWYLVWAVARAAGAQITRDVGTADIVMYFDDSTQGEAPRARARAGARLINFACSDVSKSRVGATFADVFGEALTIDPRTWNGPAVEKSERNGVHDGRVVHCPRAPEPGKVYQRLVDNRAADGLVEDLRCPTVDGEIPVVFIKRRAESRRFANENEHAVLARPQDVFSEEERARLRAFAQAMGLQWGGLDVLRDRQTGQIYVVDVNKTDMGPPTAMALADQIRAVERLATAFRAAFFGEGAR